MMWRTHAGTGTAFGLVVVDSAQLVGRPLPPLVVLALPVASGYLSAVADVDHNGAKIRYACPPAWLLYRTVRFVVGLFIGGVPFTVGWTERRRRRLNHWFGHRRIMHSYVTAVVLGLATFGTLYALLPGWLWFDVTIGLAMTLGCAGHIYGDTWTVHGCPTWAPFSWKNRGPRRLRTNTDGEERFRRYQVGVNVALVALPIVVPTLVGGR